LVNFFAFLAAAHISRRPVYVSIKEGYPSEIDYFTDIGSSSMKTVADRHRHAAIIRNTGDELFWDIHLDDLKQP